YHPSSCRLSLCPLPPVTSAPLLHSFCSTSTGSHRALHSFPTRRSSDLVGGARLSATLAARIPAEIGCQLQQVFGMAEGNTRRKGDRKSTRLNSSHVSISYAVFCLKTKKTNDYR